MKNEKKLVFLKINYGCRLSLSFDNYRLAFNEYFHIDLTLNNCGNFIKSSNFVVSIIIISHIICALDFRTFPQKIVKWKGNLQCCNAFMIPKLVGTPVTFKIWNRCISSCQIQCPDHVFVAIQGRDV